MSRTKTLQEDASIYAHFGLLVKSRMDKMKISITRLTLLISMERDVYMVPDSVRKIIDGTGRPSLAIAVAIAKVLDIDLSQLKNDKK